ncbi:AAA ATPase midasin [Exophiala sideris]|uniref:Midasin n=1 Tax=Exophiala sideris TaxID=1016849 RepID=A0ABR0JCM8_9EURO|nr:AAA ATPase midasin [Exophiala sideris]KAK5038578.1 AAA ATPase midasin [Exophiala sideris]KAK5060459.1 AAA ATPase midasin [Exophiala sideris]KAK5183371.1 AAA ATPase midasin [Eurotiomycetes sp. CCFEE 6388]
MEDIAVYCSWADAQLREDARLPLELRSIILQSRGSQYFNALADAARRPHCADVIFPLYNPVYPELIARWTSDLSASPTLRELVPFISSLARILPYATYFRHHVKQLLVSLPGLTRPSGLGRESSLLDDQELSSFLIALFRLLSFDRDILAETVAPAFLSSFLRHQSSTIRYLAVQCFCMVMHYADAFSEQMVEKYVGKDGILGDWEGKAIDYRLLKLWEEKRWKDLSTAVIDTQTRFQHVSVPSQIQTLNAENLNPRTANLGGVLLPRSAHLAIDATTFVLTATAKQNLQQFGQCLREGKPVILLGPQGSGKTALVHEAARLLNKLSTMITLHLNEQTDAKTLLGIYTSSPDGTSFTWQAGILTKAIQQGRWVLIEDIDRAPAEVMGVLRPILENGELFLPNRKETIRPKDGFRILATLKATGRSPMSSSSRQSWLLNPRLWSAVDVTTRTQSEIEVLLSSRYPKAGMFIPTVLQVHEEVCALYRENPAFKSLQTRIPSIRDLLNWTRRIIKRLPAQGLVSPSRPLAETTKFDIFKDAVDCYAGYLNEDELHELVAASVARTMNISPQQMRHCLDEGVVHVSDKKSEIQIGRSALAKVASRRRQSQRAPFALTKYAQRTLDRIAASASCSEPCLLVGETGVGKTTLVQHIANLVGQKLTVVNLSQQSEVSDLLGGLKPVTTRSLVLPLVEQFNTLFDDTFSSKRNEKFQIAITKAVIKQNWPRLTMLWHEAIQMAAESLNAVPDSPKVSGDVHAKKKRKLANPRYEALRSRWAEFSEALNQIRSQIDHGDKNHTFAFVEGRLVQAVRQGEWVLLDEINLASADTLDHIVSLLNNGDDEKPSLLLAEAGSIESVVAHPNFRIFAAMNPATDAGKKDLAPGLRSRFTELYVPSGDNNAQDLTKIIQTYLGTQLDNDKRAALDLARAYLDLKKLNQEHKVTDGAGDVPHFSIRSLVRCLLYVSQHSASHGLRRAMFEGFAMSFFTVLSRASESLALPFLEKHLLSSVKNKKSFLSQQPKMPFDGDEYIAFRHHLVKKGPMSPDFQPHYIRTSSVERNLLNLARAASMRRFPILLQGPTSAGKTSMVEYLAKLSGNKFVRINNHEHTDLQEYLGSYVSDADGKLQYREGVLVDALRRGDWIVLDELNLAPSDVLEALNRLLDDNRELLIPESQEIVRPHPNFMLFATQNPAGLYGGRKRLSRAFRNRFLEFHFDDIPENELEIILRERSQIAPSFCTLIVDVYKKLSVQRQSSRLFEQRNSFATLRDLFRWASRAVDDKHQLAHHGFMLLAERVRDPVERAVVKTTIEKTMKVVIDENALYGLPAVPEVVRESGAIVWTSAMRRLFVLVSEALKHNEPVLLVGETGCGKTQICQVIATAFGRRLDIYNAHTNTETGDLIGSQRPIRNRSELADEIRQNWSAMVKSTSEDALDDNVSIDHLIESFATLDKSAYDAEYVARLRASIGAYQSLFAWRDGSLVRAMKAGDHFLLDEISLADDSVLERLNSVLEPSRTILLAEKGSFDNFIVADPMFQFLATMNPGGDYGKRELSAALRNRLTEIWVPPLSQEADILPIIENRLTSRCQHMAAPMLKFAVWFRRNFHNTGADTVPLRDLLAWADFIGRAAYIGEDLAFVHGGFMVYIDSIGANPAGMTSISTSNLTDSRRRCLQYLQELTGVDVLEQYEQTPELMVTAESFCGGPFSLPRHRSKLQEQPDLVFDAPTTLRNTMRIVRALQMTRPVLLEGSPGVGKTAIVTALARAAGKDFTRINLSDQTDLMDLFGADAPSEGDQLGTFSWQNGPLLEAMQNGGWVLLDEMNLASQSVLEGLNSCLDHRREVYIAELDKSFTCHPEFTMFAAQNPHHQGGGRKGLPASFVNRFTVVYADSFEEEDLMRICQAKFARVPLDQLENVVKTAIQIDQVVPHAAAFAQGGPWEANLRDVSRWLAMCEAQPTLPASSHFRTIVAERFRTPAQRNLVYEAFEHVWQTLPAESFYSNLTPTTFQVGTAFLPRDATVQQTKGPNSPMGASHLPAANSIITAVNKNWPVILAGPSASGKTTLIRSIAAACGIHVVEFSMNADVDTMDLVGGFEQYDVRRDIVEFQQKVRDLLREKLTLFVAAGRSDDNVVVQLLDLWHDFEVNVIALDNSRKILSTVAKIIPTIADAAEALASKLEESDTLRSRFVWNDGILVDAIESGSWLVLDNANLCNPSVLDRLNSLLEPNGVLTLSEHHSACSGSRVIKPHPNFRVFLTLDPRYGELSRAMRNRSLEVFLPPPDEEALEPKCIQFPYASSTTRLRHLFEATSTNSAAAVIEPYVDNLSSKDMALISDGSRPLPVTGDGQILSSELRFRETFNFAEAYQMSGLPPRMPDLYVPQLLSLDEPLVQFATRFGDSYLSPEVAELLVKGWHIARRMAIIRIGLKDALDCASTKSVKEMSLLEKSTITTKLPKQFAGVPHTLSFADEIISGLSAVLTSSVGGAAHQEVLDAVGHVLAYVYDVILLSNAKTLDFALFQAYLQIAAYTAVHLEGKHPGLAALFRKALKTLSIQGVTLRTGLGLQLMWPHFQPKVVESLPQLEMQLHLEDLVAKFDTICHSLPQSRLSLSALRLKLLQTYISVTESEGPQRPLVALQAAVAELESQSQQGFVLQGHFPEVMTYIDQVLTLQGRKADQAEVQHLAMFIPNDRRRALLFKDQRSVPGALSRLAAVEPTIFSAHDSIATVFTRQLSSEAASLTTAFEDLVAPLIPDLRTVVSGMLFSHYDMLTEPAQACFSDQGLLDLQRLSGVPGEDAILAGQDRDFFKELYLRYVYPTMTILATSESFGVQELMRCLIMLSLAGLNLMVPDKIFDPAIYPNVASQLHQQRTNELKARIDGQMVFHQHVMGQDTSLVIRELQKELLQLGTVAPPPKVFRPSRTELHRLQELFSRIVHVVLDDQSLVNGATTGTEWLHHWASGQGKSNLRTIIDRLETSNRAYDDFVKPILWFMKCFSLGVEIFSARSIGHHDGSAVMDIIKRTPFLGADPTSLRDWSGLHEVDAGVASRLHWLEYLGLRKSVLHSHSLKPVEGLVEVLDQFYLEWKSHLTSDQAEAAIQSRYYAYRGDAAKDEEYEMREMNEMFPDFTGEDQQSENHEPKYDARAAALKLAKLQEKIYAAQDPQEALRNYALHALSDLTKGKNTGSGQHDQSFTALLPAIMLLMELKVAELTPTHQRQALNIYNDSDVVECEKLFNLVQQVQARFYTIANMWPEHAVPAEVLSFCNEVLHLSLNDPIAKLMTKTEKLYEIVSRWQSVASREWSVSPLLDQMTAFIVSWRRLELLSWAGLLDEEKRRHEEDAQAWYFIAYESVIYNSVRMAANGENMQSFCRELAQTLEGFFKTTTLGQYSSRLALLTNLNKTLAEIAANDKLLLLVHICVTNVIEHYRRYAPTVEASLQTGRADLEKSLKEQIKLASWKDTNITALRDSARRSHHKLFKIVRKYRALLNQVVTVFKPSRSPDADTRTIDAFTKLSEPSIGQDEVILAAEQCQQTFTDWKFRPDRLTNPLIGVKMIRHLYQSRTSELEVHLELASFRENLNEAIKDLRSQTPPKLTEENTAIVKHIQERKKRLLAETLNAVLQMGIRRNLSGSELEKQSSCAAILASSPNMLMFDTSSLLSDANDEFHELLDVMAQVRAGHMDHSDDLTSGQVSRGMGLLEGFLSIILTQRQSIASSSQTLKDLQAQVALLRICSRSPPRESPESSHGEGDIQGLCQRMAWLSEILTLAHRLVSFQAKHAEFDAQQLLDGMQSYSGQIRTLTSKLEDLPVLPLRLESEDAGLLRDESLDMLKEICSFLTEWQVREPRVGFVLRQITPWSQLVSEGVTDNDTRIDLMSVATLDASMRTISDQIFHAMQRLDTLRQQNPQSIEEPGWLIKTNSCSTQALRSTRAETVSASLGSLLDQLHCLAEEQYQPAYSLLRLASPVIEQYSHIFEHLYNQQKAVHLESCRLALQLATSFNMLITQGFCRPSEPSDGEEQTGTLESGTGLGEGEGAEDISKDIGADEDLSELAQSGEKEEQDGDIEDVDDAVDMGNDDLQGEMGDAEDQKSDEDREGDNSEDEDGDDIDEETGSVDDLDPNAVDEKMWDDIKNESEEKEMKNDKAKGNKSDDQTAADGEKADDEDMEGLEGEEQVDKEDGDEDEGAERPEGENMEPHVENEGALELPEELQLAGDDDIKDDDISDDGMDELSDIEKPADEEVELGDSGELEKEETCMDEIDNNDETTEQADEEDGVAQDDEIMEDQPAEEETDEQVDHQTREEDATQEPQETAGGESGAANDLQDTVDPEQNTQGMNETDKEPNPEQSRPGKAPENQEQGDTGKGATEQGAGRVDSMEHQQDEALRKLADVLDQWHNRREILPASEEKKEGEQDQDVDMADVDFEHVQEENEGDAQALGAAAGDQAQNLDQSKAIEDDKLDIDENTDLPDALEPERTENMAERLNHLQAQSKASEVDGSGAFVPGHERQTTDLPGQERDTDSKLEDLAPDIEHLELNQDVAIASPPTSTSDAAQLWNQCSATTHQFSLLLTEQLRLILSPTTATKLRGDYRTGKRLNIKRIIPYIASNYKRDKIWMRRSVPSKRNYQIMVAVDDSKSMSESGADLLAFETLAMLTKALSMLEVGEICVVGFGDEEHVRVAHPFGTPFSPAESGVNVFHSFTFNQRGTNVRNMVRESIQLFRDARLKGHSTAEDLWQLQLIVSDGHCSDHEGIARLVRQAQAEKIIIVFVIVDAGQDSILEMQEAVYEPDPNSATGEMKLRTRRYLEDFPFPYYLVVRDVRDLPGVLATALKGWFGSVVDVQG